MLENIYRSQLPKTLNGIKNDLPAKFLVDSLFAMYLKSMIHSTRDIF